MNSPHRREEAQPQVLVADMLEELAEQRLVLGPHRADEDLAAALEREAALPLLRIGPHREARVAAGPLRSRLGRDPHPGHRRRRRRSHRRGKG